MEWITAILTWFAADHAVWNDTAPRAAAAADCAYATFVKVDTGGDEKPAGKKP
jgi:hypothetical protein